MENNTNIEQDGLNIFEFLKVMIGYNKKGLIRLACVTVGVALVAFLILVFGYNRSKDYYVSEFNYLVETFDGDTYLDGTKFIALDLISEESLKKVKESNEQFNSIDIAAMLKEDDISIERNEAPSMYAFTISVKKSCFQSSNQAAEFIKAIASIPQTTTNKMISQINNSGALTSYTEYDMTYEAKIDDLIAQTNVINSIYASLIEKYSDRNINEEFGEGVKISTLQTKASKMITNMHLDELKAVAESNYYVYDYESALPILENKLTNYNERLDVVSNKIKAISDEIDRQLASASNANVDGLNSQLAALLIEKEDLNHNITLVQNKITYGATTDTTEYDAKLTGYYNSVKELTDEATRVQKYVLTYNQKVYFDSNNVVTRTGGLSTIISIIVSVVIGFVVALIVNLIFDLTPYKQYHLSKVRAAKEEKEVTENKDNEQLIENIVSIFSFLEVIMEKVLWIKKKTKYFMETSVFSIILALITLVSFMFDMPEIGYFSFGIIALFMLIADADFRNIIPLFFLYFGCWNYNQMPIPSVQFYILLGLLIIDGVYLLIKIISKRKELIHKFSKDGYFYSLLGILAAMLLSLIVTPSMVLSWTGIGYFSVIIFIYFLVKLNVPATEDAKKTIVESIIITGIMIAFQCFYLLFYRLHDGMDFSTILRWKKLTFGWAHSNHYTAILNIGIILSIYYFSKYRSVKNRIFALFAFICFIAVNILTVCRAGYLAIVPTLLISIVVYFIYNKKIQHNKIVKDLLYLISIFIIGVMGIIILVKTGLIQEVIDHLKEIGFDDNLRDIVFKTGWDQFKANPWLGGGVYTTIYYIKKGLGIYNYHNYFIQIMGTCGMVGLIPFLFYLFFSIKRTIRKDLYSVFVSIIIIYFLIHGLFDTMYFNHLIMTLLCVLQAVQINEKEEGEASVKKIIINGKFLSQRVTGVQRVAYEMLKELDKDVKPGMVEIACPKSIEKIPEYQNIKVIKVGKFNGNLWEQISFPRYVKKEKGVALSLCNSAPLRNTGYITIHDAKVKRHPEYYSLKFRLWYNFMFKRTLKRSIHIFTDSEFSLNEISESYKINKDKFTIGYLGWQHYASIPYDENTLSKYGLEKNKYFFAMGSMDPTKNFKWIAENAKNNPDYIFAIAGSINNAVFSDKMGFDCPSNVKVLGFVSDAEAKTLMRDSVAFLFPSHYEGFGIPPLEAMSAGAKRIITSDIPIMHELFEGYVTFIDPLKYDYTMNDLIQSDEKDFKEILDKFSWKKTEEAFYNVLFKE